MRLLFKSVPVSGRASAVAAATWVVRWYVQRHHLFPRRMNFCFRAPLAHHQPGVVRWVGTDGSGAAAVAAYAVARGSSSDFVDLGLGDWSLPVVSGGEEPKHQEEQLQKQQQQPILGVTREAEVSEAQEYSRLKIPLAPSARDGRAELRPNTRSVVAIDGTLCITRDEKEGDNLVDTPSPSTGSAMDGAACETSLPYDDERFAEMLLEMEVEGAIDEVWQDARRAHMEDVTELVEVLRSLKVRDVCAVDVSAKTSNFDYMVFGTCEGPRHIHLAAWAVQEADSVERVSKIKRKQTDHLWEVVPVGRIIVNLMQESTREELSLERKWAVTKSMDPLSAANAPVSEGRMVKAHGLWTLTLNLQDLEDFEVDYCKDVLMRQL